MTTTNTIPTAAPTIMMIMNSAPTTGVGAVVSLVVVVDVVGVDPVGLVVEE